MATLRVIPNDCARCDGDRNYEGKLRTPCDTCLRALAPAPLSTDEEKVWYSKFMGVPIKDGKCDYYWSAE